MNAGDTIEVQWTPWPISHKGPVLDYLAKCDGSCVSFPYYRERVKKANPVNGWGRRDYVLTLFFFLFFSFTARPKQIKPSSSSSKLTRSAW